MRTTLVVLFFVIVSCQKKSFTSFSSSDTVAAIIVGNGSWPSSFGFGRPATQEEIAAWDIDVRPDGQGLPEGTGNFIAGRLLYKEKCSACHGKTGVEGKVGGRLVTPPGDSSTTKTIGNYWPYATTVFDYIRRAMPYNQPGSLTDEEVYHLTAFLLAENRIIDSATIVNKESLPKIVMPAQHLFVPDDRTGGPEIR